MTTPTLTKLRLTETKTCVNYYIPYKAIGLIYLLYRDLTVKEASTDIETKHIEMWMKNICYMTQYTAHNIHSWVYIGQCVIFTDLSIFVLVNHYSLSMIAVQSCFTHSF